MIFNRVRKIETAFLLALPFAVISAAPALAGDAGLTPVVPPSDQLAACREGALGTSVLVSVKGIVGGDGNVRVQVYSDNPADFLASGKKLVRIDVPTIEDSMDVCVPLPGMGTYAFVVMHDKNANGKADILSEGFGFSNNPKLRFSVPDYAEVAYNVMESGQKMDVTLTYVFQSSEDKSKKRRRRR